jgi:hypothetical protein
MLKVRKINGSSFLDFMELLHTKRDDNYDMLIDFHNNKDWVNSKNITVSFIPHTEGAIIIKIRDKGGYYILDGNDKSIKYICGIYKRYEYIDNGDVYSALSSMSHLDARGFTREFEIGLDNKESDVLVDNGKNKEYYECPETMTFPPEGKVRILPDKEQRKFENPFIIKERGDGGLDLYGKETGQLKYVCNIGKRYEYYFAGKYRSLTDDYSSEAKNDILIELVHYTDDNSWLPIFKLIAADKNPYIVRKREDGGVDLISKDDNSLKYICNVGKTFYYLPYSKDRKYY